HRRKVRRRSQRADDREDLVLLRKLVRGEHRLLRVIAVVLDDEFQLAAVNAAGVVDLVDAHLHAVHRRLRERHSRSRHVLGGSQHDFVLRNALHLRQRKRCAQCERNRNDQLSHGSLLRVLGYSTIHAASFRYIDSISSRYFSLTSFLFSFIVGVSSSSSGESFCSISRNFFTCSTRAKCLFTLSISPWISSWTSGRRHRLAKLENGIAWSCA